MATWKEWDTHFKDLPTEDLQKLNQALLDLENDTLLKKEFEWTGLFNLQIYTENILKYERGMGDCSELCGDDPRCAWKDDHKCPYGKTQGKAVS